MRPFSESSFAGTAAGVISTFCKIGAQRRLFVELQRRGCRQDPWAPRRADDPAALASAHVRHACVFFHGRAGIFRTQASCMLHAGLTCRQSVMQSRCHAFINTCLPCKDRAKDAQSKRRRQGSLQSEAPLAQRMP